MDAVTVGALALVLVGAVVTRSVWRMGYVAGLQHGIAELRRVQAELAMGAARAAQQALTGEAP